MLTSVMLALATCVAVTPALSHADGEKHPMALMVMFDGLRADGIESGSVDLTGREAEVESLAKGEEEGNERSGVITWQSANKPTNVKFLPKKANAESCNYAYFVTGQLTGRDGFGIICAKRENNEEKNENTCTVGCGRHCG